LVTTGPTTAPLGSLVALPGVLALTWVVRGRGRRTTAVGVGLVGLGLVASVAHALAFYGMAAIDGTSHASIDARSPPWRTRPNEHPLFVVAIVAFILGLTMGPIVLT